MTKKISLLALTAIFLAACTSPSTVQDKVEDKISEKVDKVETTKKSLKDLLSLGVAQKCVYNFTDEGVVSTGELLVSGNKFKQVTKISSEEGVMTVSAYSDGEYMYTWNDKVKNSGFKMKLGDGQDLSNSENKDQDTSVDLEKQYDYRCTPTVISAADFSLPDDIKFVDYSELSKFGGMDLEKLQQQFGTDDQ
jgi:outer membrane lipoprotein-sorting protein